MSQWSCKQKSRRVVVQSGGKWSGNPSHLFKSQEGGPTLQAPKANLSSTSEKPSLYSRS